VVLQMIRIPNSLCQVSLPQRSRPSVASPDLGGTLFVHTPVVLPLLAT
jgi:hypothetical protein